MRIKRSGIITKIVVLALIVYAMTSLLNLRAKIDAAKADQQAVRQQVSEKEVENAKTEYLIDPENRDEAIADIARELGYVAPDETVFYSDEAP